MNKLINISLLIVLIFAGILLDVWPMTIPDDVALVLHFSGFCTVATLSIIVLNDLFGERRLNYNLTFILIAGGILATIAEIAQRYAPLRTCSFEDWLANLTGISIPVLIAYFINRKKFKRFYEGLSEELD